MPTSDTPDLQQAPLPPMAAIVRLRNLALSIPISDSDTDPWDKTALMAGADAIERAEDTLEQLQAAQAEVERLWEAIRRFLDQAPPGLRDHSSVALLRNTLEREAAPGENPP